MIGEKMAPAILAPLSEASVGPVIDPDPVSAFCDFYTVGCPEREGVDRSGRPLPAGAAVAIAHSNRLTRCCKLNGTAEALPLMDHRVTL